MCALMWFACTRSKVQLQRVEHNMSIQHTLSDLQAELFLSQLRQVHVKSQVFISHLKIVPVPGPRTGNMHAEFFFFNYNSLTNMIYDIMILVQIQVKCQ